MARISGVDLPREKRVEIGLTYIYGIGRVSSNRILAEANVNPDTRLLSTNWKTFSVTNASIASNFLKSLDVHSDFSTKITFNCL